MEFEWDAAKDTANIAKHGIALADAARLDWVNGATTRDTRFDYGERRFLTYAMIDGRMHTCAYTVRNQCRRFISLRKSNLREL